MDYMKHLATPPEEQFYNYLELVIDEYSEEIYNNDKFQKYFLDSETEHNWVWRLSIRLVEPKDAAKILERGFNLYYENN